MEELRIDRGSLEITLRCTLKCKLCAAYAPCYKIAPHYSYDYLKETLDRYFEIVDFVGDFSISGGEPLLHKEINEIIEYIFHYHNCFNRFLILTNGTLLFREDTISLLKNLSKLKPIQVNISDYGEVSSKVSELKKQLEDAEISYRVINYHGVDVFSGGWIDYGDHTQKVFTVEERNKGGRECVFAKMHSSYVQKGEIHRCGRAYRRMELGIIPRNKEEYVDLFDNTISVAKKKEIVRELILHKDSTEACAFCNGMKQDSKRFPPAEQL